MEYQGKSEYNDELHYDHKGIESTWQAKWDEEGIFKASDDKTLPKYFPLIEFPYPSGHGLHVGHPRPYTALDIVARKRRIQGFNVLYPIGWDAFGLPTENYAIKNKIHPKKVTENNIKRFKSQLKSLGISFDWSREINTTDPGYYKWTQWIFLKLFEKGLAYKKKSPINWCTDCKVGLANEEVVGGVCERCGGEVVRRVRTQWMLKITEYAERLINDLEQLDFIERVKVQQINWIGRSDGMEVDFKISMNCLDRMGRMERIAKAENIVSAEGRVASKSTVSAESSTVSAESGVSAETESTVSVVCGAAAERSSGSSSKIRVFTTRPDTLFGATYMILSPEHPFVDQFAASISNWAEVEAYREAASHKSDFERTEMVKDKTGVCLTGLNAINPVNAQEIPIWISDYVLMSYGTGAIMAVPGHDDRDWEFARKFGLPVVEVVAGGDIVKEAYTDIESGVMINSGFITGMQVKDAITAISDWLEAEGLGTKKVNYKLRDWVFSRQRYWGEPIPLVFCERCGWVPIPESELPLLLPEVEYYVPTDTGESPLAKLTDWVNTTCPSCGGPGLRETDTMPQWAGSSWYFLRYTDPRNDKAFASREALDYWTPVDWYNGGMEHTTLHLLYSRFWHKFLFDLGLVPTSEPYSKRTSHGMIMGENNEKMSKSRGNVVNPDDIIDEFGADTLRLYEMFIGDFEKSVPWSQNGVKGCRRFLDRVWRMQGMIAQRMISAKAVGTANAVGAAPAAGTVPAIGAAPAAGTAIVDETGAAGTAAAQPQSSFSGEMEVKMHRTIKKVSEDFESMKFNTAIAALMTLVNDFYAKGSITTEEFKTFLILLNPVAPHISEELWQKLGFDGRVCKSGWPVWDEAKTVEDMIEIAIQINGKVKERIFVPSGLDKTQTEEKALSDNKVQLLLTGKSIIKVVGVPGKIVNIVIKSG